MSIVVVEVGIFLLGAMTGLAVAAMLLVWWTGWVAIQIGRSAIQFGQAPASTPKTSAWGVRGWTPLRAVDKDKKDP